MESLKHRRDFKKVTHEGQKWVTPAFVLYVFFDPKSGDSRAEPRVGFTVTKKSISKKAVLRNRAKRRLREAFRLTIDGYKLGGAQLVVVARSDALDMPFDKLHKDIRWAFKRLNIERKVQVEKKLVKLSFGQRICLWLIKGYKIILSPIAGNQCRYTPTCSEYMAQAVIRFGVVKGIWLGTKRIFRCTPWGGCGRDEVPKAFSWFSNAQSSASVPHNHYSNKK